MLSLPLTISSMEFLIQNRKSLWFSRIIASSFFTSNEVLLTSVYLDAVKVFALYAWFTFYPSVMLLISLLILTRSQNLQKEKFLIFMLSLALQHRPVDNAQQLLLLLVLPVVLLSARIM